MKKRSLNIGVFDPKNIAQASPMCGDEVFAKGLEALGYEVVRFDYRSTRTPDYDLIELIQSQKEAFDIIWIGKAERILDTTIDFLRQHEPLASFIKWAADVRENPTLHDISHLQHIDLFVATFGGQYLKEHRKAMPANGNALSMIAFTDSDFYKPMSVSEEWKSDVLWTGRMGFGDNEMRNEVISYLLNKSQWNTKIFGLEDWIGYPDYLYAINGTKIGIGINSFNRSKYSSDRLGNYMSCGTFYLAHYFEGIEEVFQRGVHLDWFHNVEELEEKIKFYLKNDDLRKRIAKNGREFILNHFDAKPLTKSILAVLQDRKKVNNWDDFY